jgi:GAF domain-containing protein
MTTHSSSGSTEAPPSISDTLAVAGERWLQRTLDRLVEHVRSLLAADAVALTVVDRDGRPVHTAAWSARAELRELLSEPGSPSLAEAVLARDRPLLLPAVEAWEAAPDLRAGAAAAMGGGRADRAWALFGGASLAACPVRSETGRAIGVLTVASIDTGRPLGSDELRTTETLAALAAMALERAQMLDAEAGRSRRELQLKRAAEDVSSSLDPDEVHRRIAACAAELTGATKALLTRLNPRSRRLRPAASIGFSEAFVNERLTLDRGALGQVARTRVPAFTADGSSAPWDRALMQRERMAAVMHAPIELGPRLYGVLTVAHEQPARFDEGDLELLTRLARTSAAAIANAIDYQRERRIARALTLGFVPESLPSLAGYETGVLYAPAQNEATGGDVYGAWRLPSGELAVLVGDVAGKGVETAALSAMVRFFVEARSWDEPSPGAVLAETNRMLCSRLPDDTFVTAFLGFLSADGMRFGNAGHLPPLLLSGGEARELLGHGLPLGVAEDAEYDEAELRLARGDIVLAFTDGLVEARRSGVMYGSERLGRLAAGWATALGPDALVRAVHEEIAGWAGGLDDDAVALALRRRS